MKPLPLDYASNPGGNESLPFRTAHYVPKCFTIQITLLSAKIQMGINYSLSEETEKSYSSLIICLWRVSARSFCFNGSVQRTVNVFGIVWINLV